MPTKIPAMVNQPQDSVQDALPIEQALPQAIACHQGGHLQEAERLYRAILQVQPRHPVANHNLGVLAVQVKQPAAGLPHFKVSLEVDPKQGQYWISFIDALIQAGQLNEAYRVLAQGRASGLQGGAVDAMAERLNGPLPEQMSNLAAMFNQGRYAEGEAMARGMTEKFPNHGFGWKVLCSILHKLGRVDDSLQAKVKAALLMPVDADAHNNMGHSLQEMGRLTEAECSLRKALALDPKHPVAYNNLGLTLQKKGQLSDAEASYRQALKIKPDYAEAYKNLGNIFLARKMMKDAVSCYEKAIAIAPDYEAAYNNLGAVHFASGNMDLAVLCCQKAYELKPSSTGALHNLGLALYHQGDINAAIECFKKALPFERDGWVVDSAAFLAVLYYLMDDMPRAMQVVKAFKGEVAKGGAEMGAYFGYLDLLMTSNEKTHGATCQNSGGALYVIGDSHALSLHNLQVTHMGMVKTCRSRWIVGCKQWHLSSDQANNQKYKFHAELAQLPRQSTVLLTFGEIDCRWNEGILKACKKFPDKSLDEIAQATVMGYVRYVSEMASQYSHQLIIGGVPATNAPLNTLKPEVADQLVRLIRIFNAMLKDQALSAGLDFLDVYELTNRGDGVANGKWHIDAVHLAPGAMAEAFKVKQEIKEILQ